MTGSISSRATPVRRPSLSALQGTASGKPAPNRTGTSICPLCGYSHKVEGFRSISEKSARRLGLTTRPHVCSSCRFNEQPRVEALATEAHGETSCMSQDQDASTCHHMPSTPTTQGATMESNSMSAPLSSTPSSQQFNPWDKWSVVSLLDYMTDNGVACFSLAGYDGSEAENPWMKEAALKLQLQGYSISGADVRRKVLDMRNRYSSSAEGFAQAYAESTRAYHPDMTLQEQVQRWSTRCRKAEKQLSHLSHAHNLQRKRIATWGTIDDATVLQNEVRQYTKYVQRSTNNTASEQPLLPSLPAMSAALHDAMRELPVNQRGELLVSLLHCHIDITVGQGDTLDATSTLLHNAIRADEKLQAQETVPNIVRGMVGMVANVDIDKLKKNYPTMLHLNDSWVKMTTISDPRQIRHSPVIKRLAQTLHVRCKKSGYAVIRGRGFKGKGRHMRFQTKGSYFNRKVGVNNASRKGENMEINLPLPAPRTVIRHTNKMLRARIPAQSSQTVETLREWREVGREHVSTGGAGVSADMLPLIASTHNKKKGIITLAMDGTKINPEMSNVGTDGKGEADLGGVCVRHVKDLDDRQVELEQRRARMRMEHTSTRSDAWQMLVNLQQDDVALEVHRRSLRIGLDRIRLKKMNKCHKQGFQGDWDELSKHTAPEVSMIVNRVSDHEQIVRQKFKGCEILSSSLRDVGCQIATLWGLTAEWQELIDMVSTHALDNARYMDLLEERVHVLEEEDIYSDGVQLPADLVRKLNEDMTAYVNDYYKYVTAIVAEEALGVTMCEGERLYAAVPVYLGFVGKSQPSIVGRHVLDACIEAAARQGIIVNNVTFDGQYSPVIRRPEIDMFEWVKKEETKVKLQNHQQLANTLAQAFKRVLDVEVAAAELVHECSFVDGAKPQVADDDPVARAITALEHAHLSHMQRERTLRETLYEKDLLDVCTAITVALQNPLVRDQSTKSCMNVNTCTLENLCELPGIGDGKARAIIRARDPTQPFGEGPTDMLLTSVDGISPAICAKIQAQITYDGHDYVPGNLRVRKRKIEELRALYRAVVVIEHFTRNTDTRPSAWQQREHLQSNPAQQFDKSTYAPYFGVYNLHTPEIHPATRELLFVTPCSQHILKCIWHCIAAGGHTNRSTHANVYHAAYSKVVQTFGTGLGQRQDQRSDVYLTQREVDALTDKMNVDIMRKIFAPYNIARLQELGETETAELASMCNNLYEACQTPGYTVEWRKEQFKAAWQWLMRDVRVSVPLKEHVHGISYQTWQSCRILCESMLQVYRYLEECLGLRLPVDYDFDLRQTCGDTIELLWSLLPHATKAVFSREFWKAQIELHKKFMPADELGFHYDRSESCTHACDPKSKTAFNALDANDPRPVRGGRLLTHSPEYKGVYEEGHAKPGFEGLRTLSHQKQARVAQPTVSDSEQRVDVYAHMNKQKQVMFVPLPMAPKKKSFRQTDETTIRPLSEEWRVARVTLNLRKPRHGFKGKRPINASRLRFLAGYGVNNNEELCKHWQWDNGRGPEPHISEEIQPALKYGTWREEDALAVVILDVEGRLRGKGARNIQILQAGLFRPEEPADTIKATPDFLIKYTDRQGTDKYIVVEIKCPYFGPTGSMGTADSACRPYYLLQTHAQMAGVKGEWGVEVEGAILYSWSPSGATSFPIQWNNKLWGQMVDLVEDWHTRETTPKKSDPLRVLLRNTCSQLGNEASKGMRTHTAAFSKREVVNAT